jgi:hypothetical protein
MRECDDCGEKKVRHYTLATDSKGNIVRDEGGAPKWVQSGSAANKGVAEFESNNTASVNVNCRTTPTDTSGRKTCNDTEVHQLPPDYVFAQNEATTAWHSDIGSSNSVDISWEDFAEIAPGSGYMLPRRMIVNGHARSGHGYGERGHTDATVTCRFFRRVG